MLGKKNFENSRMEFEVFEPFGWFGDLSPLQQCVFRRTVLDVRRSLVFFRMTVSNFEKKK